MLLALRYLLRGGPPRWPNASQRALFFLSFLSLFQITISVATIVNTRADDDGGPVGLQVQLLLYSAAYQSLVQWKCNKLITEKREDLFFFFLNSDLCERLRRIDWSICSWSAVRVIIIQRTLCARAHDSISEGDESLWRKCRRQFNDCTRR